MDLKATFLNLQKQMEARLTANRMIINHPGAKGDTFELNWIDWLQNYLPKRYTIDKAFVIDCDGNVSDQIDAVIYDRQYSPFVFNQDGALYIPSESVYAAFEVKPELTKYYIEYAADKAMSIRRLRRTSAPIPHAGGQYQAKSHFNIIAGILTLSSSWNPPLGQRFEETILSLEQHRSLQIGCALNAGSFIVNNENGVSIQKSSPEESLIFFFLKLLVELQKLGTTPAIDINCYASSLNSF
ncbi:hypothetical protein M7775_05920 [Sporomusa sphaeroides DSM 2875]|uniref:DUF6602 domain-containing protein n=1 Tax=Sporomusa sphaeroides TaxID=47679 RepID=UPI00202FE304|nr:DUF6602 domain-containing protein [Sporomusa sphaeroides]MCM0758112.1 hypothetical protein [Sporomusa sphaeroides DSM 2875]